MTGLGTFADMMTVDEMSVVKVDTELPDEYLALIGCGVTTGAGAALFTAKVEPGSTVAVIGCGGVGQAVIQGARIAGAARIIAIDPVALKRDSALKLGATDVIDPTDGDAGRAGAGAHERPRRRLHVRGDRHARHGRAGVQHGAQRRHGRGGRRVEVRPEHRDPELPARTRGEAPARLRVRLGPGAPRLPEARRASSSRASSTSARWSRAPCTSTTSTTRSRRCRPARSSAASSSDRDRSSPGAGLGLRSVVRCGRTPRPGVRAGSPRPRRSSPIQSRNSGSSPSGSWCWLSWLRSASSLRSKTSVTSTNTVLRRAPSSSRPRSTVHGSRPSSSSSSGNANGLRESG